MIKAYFKNNKLVGFTNDGVGGIPKDYDFVDENLTADDITELHNGGTYENGIVTPKVYTDDELLQQKKEECQAKILANYSRSDQANITGDSIISGDDIEFVKMRTFINAMLDEFHTNGKDADFSNITPE